jgi:hypothetical protein
MKKVFLGILIGAVAVTGYHHLRGPSVVAAEAEAGEGEAVETQSADELEDTGSTAPKFSCDGRTHCSQMTSCDEAMYFLENCPGVKMDGEGDGIPCEGQWCGDRR